MIRVKLTTLLAALTFVLLNPLACLLHCELLHADAGTAPTGSYEFLCHGLPLPTLGTSVELATQPPLPPRVVYDATLVLSLLLALLAAGRYHPGPATAIRCRALDAPPVPPPRMLRLYLS